MTTIPGAQKHLLGVRVQSGRSGAIGAGTYDRLNRFPVVQRISLSIRR
jgi:hypothetical protein